MSDDGEGLSADVLIGAGESAARAFTSFLGVQRERYVCPECGVACEETTVFDPARAAFDQGESPAWHCGECGSNYVREVSDESYGLDLYGRDPPQ
jgi:ribosomal protein S27AE